jgi:hypothetical protein
VTCVSAPASRLCIRIVDSQQKNGPFKKFEDLRTPGAFWVFPPVIQAQKSQSGTLGKGMSPGFRERLARLRGFVARDASPRLADESRWYTEHTALLISTLKWALLGAAAGASVGLGTRVFLWVLGRSADWARALTAGRVPALIGHA